MDRYLAVRKLGHGSYGEVYLVQALAGSGLMPGQLYALKKVPLDRGEREKLSMVAVDTEARIAGTLEHPYVIRCFGSFVEARTLCLLFEFAPNGDLQHYLQSRPHPPECQVWCWLSQLLQALSHLHSRLILHRDLKPTNIFLSAQNTLKLGDFGVARVLADTDELAKTGVGTPFYLAPEVWRGAGYGAKADMWSLGCVLYQICTGRRPFQGSLGEVVQKVLTADYQPIPDLYSRDLTAIVDSLLRTDPINRPSADELLHSPYIQKLVEQDPFTADIRQMKPSKKPYFRPISINIPALPAPQPPYEPPLPAHSDVQTTANAAIRPPATSSESAETEKAQQTRHFSFPESILKQCPRSPNRPVLMETFLRRKLGNAVYERLQRVVGGLTDAGEVLRREPWVFSSICGLNNLAMVDVGIAFEAFRTASPAVLVTKRSI